MLSANEILAVFQIVLKVLLKVLSDVVECQILPAESSISPGEACCRCVRYLTGAAWCVCAAVQ